MQIKTATIEFIKQDNNTEVQVTQDNKLTSCTWYPSELADKVQYLVENIDKPNVSVTQLTTNKVEVSYSLPLKQKSLRLNYTTTVFNKDICNIAVYVDNRPIDQDKAELIIVLEIVKPKIKKITQDVINSLGAEDKLKITNHLNNG